MCKWQDNIHSLKIDLYDMYKVVISVVFVHLFQCHYAFISLKLVGWAFFADILLK